MGGVDEGAAEPGLPGSAGAVSLEGLAPRHAARVEALRVSARALASGGSPGTDRPGLVIVGPNNAGKSTLAQRLGATAAVPGIRGGSTVEARTFGPEEASRAWLPEREYAGPVEPDLGWLLCDTPDLDGGQRGHREAAMSALRAADLALVVLTPLVYANASVEAFIGEELLDRAVPWWLVVRGAERPEAERIAAELEQRLGRGPSCTFAWRGPEAVRASDGVTLTSCLTERIADPGGVERLKGASRERVTQEARRLAAALDEASKELLQARSRAKSVLTSAAAAAASSTLPLAETVQALRGLLDPRVHPARRLLRRGTEQLGKLASGLLTRGSSTSEARSEMAALDRALPAVLEELTEIARSLQASELPGGLRAAVEAFLDPLERSRSVDRCRRSLPAPDEDRAHYRESFQELLEQELQRRGDEASLQLQMDLMITAPMAVGSAVVIKTGGLGADLVVGGLGLATSAWLERLSGYLGRSIAERARSRWIELAAARYEAHLAQLWSGVDRELAKASSALGRSRAGLLEGLGS